MELKSKFVNSVAQYLAIGLFCLGGWRIGLAAEPGHAANGDDDDNLGGEAPTLSWRDWSKETWAGDDTVFTQDRKLISGELQGLTPEDAAKYCFAKRAAYATAKDGRTLFDWALSVDLVQDQSLAAFDKLGGQLDEAAPIVEAFPSPNSYQFSRARFVLEARVQPAEILYAAGQRLLQKDPEDYAVMEGLVRCTDPKSAEQLSTARKYLTTLAAQFPQSDSMAYLTADFYTGWYFLSRKPDLKAVAEKSNERALILLKDDATRLGRIKLNIDLVKKTASAK